MTRELKPYDELSRTGKKYRDDPEYRELMKSYSMEKVLKKRKEKLKEKRNYSDDRGVKGGWKPRIVYGIKVYNNTAVGDMVNATRVTMYNWFKQDILPEPTVVDEKGRRWFSMSYVNSLRKVLANRLRGSLKVFKEELRDVFIEDGIINENGENIEHDNSSNN